MTQQEVTALLGDPPEKSGPMTVGTQPATSPVDYIVRQAILDALDSGYERWHYDEFGFLENLISPSPRAYVVYFDAAGRVVRWRRPVGQTSRPSGPYAYEDLSDTERVGGDYLETIVQCSDGPISPTLRPPLLISPANKTVYSHYPREVVLQWSPAPETPSDAQYLVQQEYRVYDECNSARQTGFGDWSKQPPPFLTFRTGKTTMNIRFVGAQPGRWRVKTIDETGESPWSEWWYFRFTRRVNH